MNIDGDRRGGRCYNIGKTGVAAVAMVEMRWILVRATHTYISAFFVARLVVG